MKKTIITILIIFIGATAHSEDRIEELMKDMSKAMQKYLLKGTQFEHAIPKEEKETVIHKFEISNSTEEVKTYGYLTIKSKYNAKIKLINQETRNIYNAEIKKNEPKEIEIEKGIYTANIEYNGRSKRTTISFLGNKGQFEIK